LASSGSRDFKLDVWDTESKQLVFEYEPTGYRNQSTTNLIAWSPDSQFLAFADGDKIGTTGSDVHIFDVNNTWQEIKTLNTIFDEVSAIAWSSGNKLAVLGGAIHIWNAADWTLEYEFFDPSQNIYAIAWSPDGNSLVGGGIFNGQNGMLVREINSEDSRILANHDGQIVHLVWLPNSSELFSINRDGIIYGWNVENSCLLAISISGN